MEETIQTAVDEFALKMGMKDVKMPPSSPLTFKFTNKGFFFIERKGEGLLLYLAKEYKVIYEQTYKKALTLCDYNRMLPFNITPGLKGEQLLIFFARLQEHQVTSQNINQILALLDELHQKCAA